MWLMCLSELMLLSLSEFQASLNSCCHCRMWTSNLHPPSILSKQIILIICIPTFTQTLFVPIKDWCLPDAEGAAGVGSLTPGIPQAFPGLASHQHWGDVVDLISCLCTGTLLGLRDATPFTPAPAGVEDQDQAQDREQKRDHPTLRGGAEYRRRKQRQKSRQRRVEQRVKGKNKVREPCQVEYGSKSKFQCQQFHWKRLQLQFSE